MRCYILLPLMGLTALVPATLRAETPPPQLLGKTILVEWVETRERSLGNDPRVNTTMLASSLRIYVSTAGHLFSELSESVQGGGVRGSASGQQGPGDMSASRGAPRLIHFERGSLILQQNRGDIGARQINVSFDNGYTSCTAHLIEGRQPGGKPIRMTGTVSGMPLKIYSLQHSAPRCSISEGPTFVGH